MMGLTLNPLSPFAAEASGIDTARPLGADAVRAIEAAMDEHAVLVLRSQPISEDQQIGLAKSFGPLDLGLRKVKAGPRRVRVPPYDTHEAFCDEALSLLPRPLGRPRRSPAVHQRSRPRRG